MQILKELEQVKVNYDKTIDLVTGLPFSQKKLIRTIEFYNNSKYLNGQKDELGRDKPFYNILNAICDVENTAKDLDTSDIQITSDDSNHYLQSFLLTKDLYVWMKESNFAKTLNDMRDIHTRYGSLLIKKCIEKEDGEKKLEIELPEWKNVITDQVDIIDGTIIETHYMNASEIYEKKDSWKNIDKVLEVLKKEGSGKRLPVYEIRGFLPKNYIYELDGKKVSDKNNEFSDQLYYIAGTPEESGKSGNFDALVPLYWEDDTEKVYKFLARKPRAGRGFGVGVMEEGEEAQVWTNDAVLKQYRAMEYTTKVIGQTASKKLKGRNLLTETDDGTLLEIEDGKPILPVNLLPAGGLQQYNALIDQWYGQLEKTTSAYGAQRGESPNSGTAFRLQATVIQQSSSVFKSLQEEFGIFITDIIEDWVLPFLVKKLSTEHILSYDFSPEELKEIDKKFSAEQANRRAIAAILSGKMVDQESYDKWIDGYDEFIKMTKGKRFIQIPKDFYSNLKAKVTVNVTGEQRNKAVTLESLNNLLVTYASNPNLSSDPVASQLLAKIVELSGAGISPVSISAAMSSKNKEAEAMQAQLQDVKPNPSQPTKVKTGNNPNMPTQ